jgi:hypothetical protein
MLHAASLVPVELWVAPSLDRDVFLELKGRVGLELRGKRGDDLGARMLHAVSLTLKVGDVDAVVLLGTDCPQLSRDHLEHVLLGLRTQDAVLVPAADGGYVLLGLRRVHRCLFQDIPWSTDRVAPLTRERLWGLGWVWSELEALAHIDRPEDLKLLPPDLPLFRPEPGPGSQNGPLKHLFTLR